VSRLHFGFGEVAVRDFRAFNGNGLMIFVDNQRCGQNAAGRAMQNRNHSDNVAAAEAGVCDRRSCRRGSVESRSVVNRPIVNRIKNPSAFASVQRDRESSAAGTRGYTGTPFLGAETNMYGAGLRTEKTTKTEP